MALESLGLTLRTRRCPQEADAVATFRTLCCKNSRRPVSPRDGRVFGRRLDVQGPGDYDGAEQYLLNARDSDASTWEQPATQRLVLGAYGKKDYTKTDSYVKEYDTIAPPAGSEAQVAARLPAAVFYWLAETARKSGNEGDAEIYYKRVTQHPDPGDLLAGAWWQLGEVQAKRKEWPDAVKSYENYRSLKPDAKNATQVLLALGRAYLGAKDTDFAKKIGEQALLQEPEGLNSAAARMLLAENAFAANNSRRVPRGCSPPSPCFSTIPRSRLPKLWPAPPTAFEQAGDAKSNCLLAATVEREVPELSRSSFPLTVFDDKKIEA